MKFFLAILAVLDASVASSSAPVCPQSSSARLPAEAVPAIDADAGTRGLTPPRVPVQVELGGRPETVHYRRYPARRTPSKGTVFWFCGGPGAACSESIKHFMFTERDLVVMDYPGTGDNRGVNSAEAMSIEGAGAAAAAVARSLRGEFVFSADSFGTAVATVAAAKLTERGNRAPPSGLRGVILDGSVGPHGATRQLNAGFVDVANLAWRLLSPDERREFSAQYTAAAGRLGDADRRRLESRFERLLLQGVSETADSLRAFSKDPGTFITKALSSPTSNVMRPEFFGPACQIIGRRKISDSSETLFGGSVPLRRFHGYDCTCRPIDRNWDPVKHQIHDVPVVYVNGEHDPTTPVDWARAHMASQRDSREDLFFVVRNYGHSVTSNIFFVQCLDSLTNSLQTGAVSEVLQARDGIVSGDCRTDQRARAPAAPVGR